MESNRAQQVQREFGWYKASGIEFKILDSNSQGFPKKVLVTQTKVINGYMLNQKQLVERTKALFGREVKVIPSVHSLDVNGIDLGWIVDKMKDLGIKRKDLVKQTGLDKTYLSRLFSGQIGLSTPMRALFHYYFQTYELNGIFRTEKNFQ
ncbi:hypothetical protein [Flagellimonas zhangzhouensis]|uniref:Uncharacterized protein n=1 Tax=Flagellimonas zhangzhouensis TaxID=1073328 RepID=A0A1H2WMZ3_9FLAO|nr:hypothetical protein [Allomuricauda zhangzhouensis]SDQ22643.1 hypothetical protein SAMN05216294_0959 [Allomuricauda zhangzhouensis]SDW81634.1 hypothetical protein SAMN04487892_2339 [Allomuricauda zhangzhouensis]